MLTGVVENDCVNSSVKPFVAPESSCMLSDELPPVMSLTGDVVRSTVGNVGSRFLE